MYSPKSSDYPHACIISFNHICLYTQLLIQTPICFYGQLLIHILTIQLKNLKQRSPIQLLTPTYSIIASTTIAHNFGCAKSVGKDSLACSLITLYTSTLFLHLRT